MGTPRQGHIEHRVIDILATGIRRRKLIALLAVAAAAPLVAHAQQKAKVPHIAIVHPSNPISEMNESSSYPGYKALFGELRRLGYLEGQNVIIERFSGGGRIENYAEVAQELVRHQPDVILAATSRMVQNLKNVTSTIPIIGLMADPVATGLVASLARPAGNITGLSVDAGLDVWSKRVGLLREAVPGASRIAFLYSRDVAKSMVTTMQEAAQRAGTLLVGPPLEGRIEEAEYRRVFKAMIGEGAGALVVSDQAEHLTNRRLIIELAEKSRLPTMYPYRAQFESGGLMVYGIDQIDFYRRAGDYVDRILQGAKPSEMPIEQATKFELLINVKAAKAIGLDIPPALVLRADEVIE